MDRKYRTLLVLSTTDIKREDKPVEIDPAKLEQIRRVKEALRRGQLLPNKEKSA